MFSLRNHLSRCYGRPAVGVTQQLRSCSTDSTTLHVPGKLWTPPLEGNVDPIHTSSGIFTPCGKLSVAKLSEEQDEKIARLWDYHSDHLPVFSTVLGVRVVSFNVLNNKFISHLKRNAWKASPLLLNRNLPSLKYSKLSIGEEAILEEIKGFLFGDNPHQVVCLQEVSDVMLKEIEKMIEGKNITIHSNEGAKVEGGKTLDNRVVTLVQSSSTHKLQVESYDHSALFSRYFYPKGDKTKPRQKGPDIWRVPACTKIRVTTPQRNEEILDVAHVHISTAGESDEDRFERVLELTDNLAKRRLPGENLLLIGDSNIPLHVRGQALADQDLIDRELSRSLSQVDNQRLCAEVIDMIHFSPAEEANRDWVIPHDPKTAPSQRAREVYLNTLHEVHRESKKSLESNGKKE